MAEGIVFPLVTELVKKLSSAVVLEIGSIYGVHKELEKLQSTFSAIKAVLLDAEQKKDHNHSVMDWLAKLKDAAYDVDDLLDCCSYESMRRKVITEGKKAKKVRIFFSKHNQIAFRHKLAHQIKSLRESLDLIAGERNKYTFEKTKDNESENSGRETHSFVLDEEVIGRDEEKEQVVKRLLEINEKHNVSVNAIVGLGGMGKTKLAQSVFNHQRVKDAFDLRLWVCISETFDLKVILQKIIEPAIDERPSVHEMDSLQRRLRTLIDGKKYLLVMDDLWNEDGEKWANLRELLMGGAKGSKILITTRTALVAEVSQATSPYILNGLSESNSWILFKQMAFKDGEEPKSPNMIQIGKEIAKECFGVPLVIRTIGRLLYFKTSEAEWLSFKNNDLATIPQQENGITQVLKLTFNHLPSHLKPCFAYCSLFSQDHDFEKDELINLWIAEGFVQSRDENKCLEDVGNEYFMELTWRSIFQDIQRNEYGDIVGCKMHDLMHNLARLVAGTECFAPNSDIKNVNGRTRRVFCDCSNEEKWSLLTTSELKPCRLRTLLLYNNSDWELNEFGLEAHVSSLKSLRVFYLQWLRMEKIPSSIGILKHLRFLNLSGNKIDSLPSSITKLHNLQTLNISRASLKELPKDIGSLINLRHLDISGNYFIQRLPSSTSKLLRLQSLIINDCRGLIELPENIGNLVNLRFLHLRNDDHIEALPDSIANLRKLQSLNLKGCTFLRKLPSDVSNLVHLQHMDLNSCDRLGGMPLGLNKLTALQTMNLYVVGASEASEYGELWQLNTLTDIRGSLHIRGLHHLRKDASRVNTVNFKGIHGLRDLSLKWEQAGYNTSDIDPDFVVLEHLGPPESVEALRIDGYGGVRLSSWVSSLPNLTSLLLKDFEILQYIPRLDRLPNLQKLELKNISSIEYVDDNETVDGFGSSVFFPSLRYLVLSNMVQLKGWWKQRELSPSRSVFLPSFHCLEHLYISGCPRLASFPSPGSSLTSLSVSYFSAKIFDGETLDGRLHSKGTLPEGLRRLTSLQSLCISDCNDLFVLPEWIGNLTSFQKLEIRDCPRLTQLPGGFSQLTSLATLDIHGCCKKLEERCRQQTGEDWLKIAHVPFIRVSCGIR